MTPYTTSMFQGALVGACIVRTDKGAVEQWPYILNGTHDRELRAWLFMQITTTPPSSEEDLQEPQVTAKLNFLKEYLRAVIQNLVAYCIEDSWQEKKKQTESRRNSSRT